MAEEQSSRSSAPQLVLTKPVRPFRLLYVEDNPTDVRIVKEALKQLELPIVLTALEDGNACLSLLRQQPPYDRHQRPDLLLLDLNLPGLSGGAILRTVKGDPNLKSLPVVVFTSAANSEFCKRIYRESANSCVRKPGDLDNFVQTVHQMCRYWFEVANLSASA